MVQNPNHGYLHRVLFIPGKFGLNLDKVAAQQFPRRYFKNCENNCLLTLPDQAKKTNYATNLLIAELNGRSKPII